MRKTLCILLLSFLTAQAFAHEGEVHEEPGKRKPSKPSTQQRKAPETTRTITHKATGRKGAYNLTFTIKPAQPLVNVETEIQVKVAKPLPKPDPLLGTETPVEEATVIGKFTAPGYTGPPITAHQEEEPGVYGIHARLEKPGRYKLEISVKTEDDALTASLPLDVKPLPGVALTQKVDMAVLVLGTILIVGVFVSQVRKGKAMGTALLPSAGVVLMGVAIAWLVHSIVAPRMNAPFEGEVKTPSLPPAETRSAEVVQISEDLQKLLEIKTTVVRARPFQSYLDVPGKATASPERVHEVHSPVIGRVEAWAHIPTVGERVSEGQVLAVVNQTLTAPEQLQIQIQGLDLQKQMVQAASHLAQTRTALSLKEKELDRARKLYEIQALAQKDLQSAEAGHRDALLEYQEAQRQVSLYERYRRQREISPPIRRFPILSPVSGVVTAMDIARGELVSPEKRLFNVMDLSLVWVQAHIYEKDLAKVSVGDRANITVSAYPKAVFQGTLKTLGSVVDPQTRTIQAIFEIPNPQGRLRDGMLAMVHLKTESRTVTAIPFSAIIEEEGKSFVFVKEAPTAFRKRSVTLGERAGESLEIAGGLSQGEAVVIQGAHSLAAEAKKQGKASAQ
ncbi:MAG: efflux RND transporter periplasmic adaptor subunit [Armatimonadetes bacterium]|nr:efflux RND transporter periplasmic adaptor subunit [Armatimonadota bacterium]